MFRTVTVRGIRFNLKNKSVFLGLYRKGLEPVLYKEVKEKEGNSSHTHYGFFFPLTRIKHRIECFLKWNYLKHIEKANPKKCTFCGEKPATKTMPDPNYGSDKILDVCDGCVLWVRDCQMETFRTLMDIKLKELGVKPNVGRS
jgi:hypothetical protein